MMQLGSVHATQQPSGILQMHRALVRSRGRPVQSAEAKIAPAMAPSMTVILMSKCRAPLGGGKRGKAPAVSGFQRRAGGSNRRAQVYLSSSRPLRRSVSVWIKLVNPHALVASLSPNTNSVDRM